MPDPQLMRRAARCYARLGWHAEAARCHRAAGDHQYAARLWERAGLPAEAARDHLAARAFDRAAWLYVHEADDPAEARAVLAEAADAVLAAVPMAAAEFTASDLTLRLVLARCDVAEGRPVREARAAIAAVTDALARADAVPGHVARDLEDRAVATAEAMHRPDLVALVFAAAVRGQRPGAAARWDDWSRRVLHVPLVLPPATAVVAEEPAEPAGRPLAG